MTTQFEIYQPHPSLGLRVDADDRSRAEAWLRRAHAVGRLDELDLERRLDVVERAEDRGQLNAAFLGLVHAPVGSTLVPATPSGLSSYAPAAQAVPSGERVVGALAHLSGLMSGMIGPAIFFAATPRGSRARREAAKAFNFQLVAFVLMIVSAVVVGEIFTSLDFVMALGFLGWFLLTIVGAARAGQGGDWRNPVTQVIRLHVLDEGPRQP